MNQTGQLNLYSVEYIYKIKVVQILQELAESDPKSHHKHQRERRTNNRTTDDKPS